MSVWVRVAALLLLLVGCRTGPDPVCVAHCERQNDACMMSASSPVAIQSCDDGLGGCLAYCR